MPLRTPRVDSYMWTTTAAVASGATQSVLLGDVILTRGSAAGGGPAALVMGQSEVVLISIRYSSQLVRRLFSLLAYIMRSRVYETVGRPSLCLSHILCGGFAAVGPAGRRYRSTAAPRAQQQIRAVSCLQRHRKLDTGDLLTVHRRKLSQTARLKPLQ